ncbi:MAG: hypothetical protein KME20_23445 [Kaiparowitsia implicata GSE-PSE-MK54-09C]|jgi:hypothetical protein|nr:hypothetical protein [Kaiparowitsia implicata GSE-PSE-MK54-09C]
MVQKNTESKKASLLIGVLTIISGLIGTGIGVSLQGYWSSQLERQKFEFALIQKALETSDNQEAAKQLLFLVDSGVLQSLDSSKIRRLAENPEQLPILRSPIVENARIFLLAGTNERTRAFNELSSELIKAGFNIVGSRQLDDPERPNEPEVRYFNSTDREQAEIIAEFVQSQLLNQAVRANFYQDSTAKPGYIEIWLGR